MYAYRIQVNSIDTTYKASSEKEALEFYAQDAGYKSYAELVEHHGEIDSIEVLEEHN